MTMISVTPADISKGVPTNFFACPVALAISRATRKSVGLAWGIRDEGKNVTAESLSYPMLCVDGKWSFADFPREVMEWINDYDRKKLPLPPISFDLELA